MMKYSLTAFKETFRGKICLLKKNILIDSLNRTIEDSFEIIIDV